jgi:hypothetical protein
LRRLLESPTWEASASHTYVIHRLTCISHSCNGTQRRTAQSTGPLWCLLFVVLLVLHLHILEILQPPMFSVRKSGGCLGAQSRGRQAAVAAWRPIFACPQHTAPESFHAEPRCLTLVQGPATLPHARLGARHAFKVSAHSTPAITMGVVGQDNTRCCSNENNSRGIREAAQGVRESRDCQGVDCRHSFF